MPKFLVEYAQYRNRQFAAWIEGDEFPTREAAEADCQARGIPSGDYMISEIAAR